MRISTILLATFAASFLVPSLAVRTSPYLTKKHGKKKKPAVEEHKNPVSWSFTLDHDVDQSTEVIELLEDIFVKSANHVYEKDVFNVLGNRIEKFTHSPIEVGRPALVRGGVSDDIDPWRRYLIWSDGNFHYACRFCYYYDDDMFFDTSSLEFTLQGRKQWEKKLCELLGDTKAFKGAEQCEVKIDFDHELPLEGFDEDFEEDFTEGIAVAYGSSMCEDSHTA